MSAGDRIQVDLSTNELLALTNALNEVVNGVDFDDDEFSTRIGVDRKAAAALLDRIRGTYQELMNR